MKHNRKNKRGSKAGNKRKFTKTLLRVGQSIQNTQSQSNNTQQTTLKVETDTPNIATPVASTSAINDERSIANDSNITPEYAYEQLDAILAEKETYNYAEFLKALDDFDLDYLDS